MKKILPVFLIIIFLLTPSIAFGMQQTKNSDDYTALTHTSGLLTPSDVGNARGIVQIFQNPTDTSTHITIAGGGLMPNHEYLSLFYDNPQCQLAPYSPQDVIGQTFTSNKIGMTLLRADVHESLSDIHSVSILDATDFHQIACTVIN